MGRSNDNMYPFETKGEVLPYRNSNDSSIMSSGNSDVDVSVLVDTTPMAYAMLCSLLASDQMTEKEFRSAVRKLEDFSKSKCKSKNDVSDRLSDERRRRK
ncbi:hypothetical protein [Halobacillus amylolyticus]|uniref:Uncharacterized protein n=1 Tax=Halobacillus amylolyticus TaxID=2932259 RepID=A0ABY4HFS7_9BACI|nr:hypothetical protein [Halobacillus amylolyticus]UOR13747.1 hypothetical protein MUO15_10050 [Halobacillus amylolyticus]